MRRNSRRRLFNPSVGLLPLTFVLLSSVAAASDGPPTHRAFVDSCRLDLARNLLDEFTPNRSHPIVIVPDRAADPDSSIAGHLSRLLSDRGLLVRESPHDNDSAVNWTLRYIYTPPELSLTEPHRRTFLGKIWVKRSLDAGLTMSVHDDAQGEEIWQGNADSTYVDWVRKGELKKLESEGFAPRAPSTGWEKAQWPLVAVGAVAVGITALVLF